jgi:hypothetical protein
MVFKSEAEHFCDCVNILANSIPKLYSGWRNKLSVANRYWLAASCVTREKEFLSKFKSHLYVFETYWKRVADYQKHDNYWPEFELESLVASQRTQGDEIDVMGGKISSALISEEKPDDYPDFAGQFLHSLGEAAFSSLLEDNEEKFVTLYPVFFKAIFAQAQKLMPSNVKEEWVRENLTKVAVTPIIDLVDLSGYAILMSEYYGNDKPRRVIEFCWGEYLGREGSLNSVHVGLVFSILATFDRAFEIPHRNEYRFRWERKVNDKLINNISYRSIIKRHSFIEDKLILHKSALVRLFAKDEMALNHNGIDIFFTFILNPMLPNESQGIINIRRNLEDELQREADFYEKHSEGKI